ncbi:MAG: DNA gyrase subunit A, partial [Chloroflexota bacterium]
GSVDGDSPAAMRYTEARMASVGMQILNDIRKETVDFADNFDGSLQEPQVLPSSVPNLLVNGASGIAVGMSTSIPPHNLGETVDALVFLIDNWSKQDKISVHDLIKFIPGPDFPTGGIIYSQQDGDEGDAISAAYATGRGRVSIQARVHIEEMSRNRHRLVISELPYQVNKANLLERIAELHREEKVEGITDLRDESDRTGMRVIIELTRTVDPEVTLAALFKQTPMQSTFSIIMLALVNGEPRLLPLKRALLVYLDHRLEVVRRRSEFELAQAKARAHILEGFVIALDNLDAVIQTIRRSRTAETAHANLRKNFKLSAEQAKAVLDMPLRRLAALEQKKIQEEYREKLRLIKRLEALLKSPKKMRELIKSELLEVRTKYADNRRTQIVSGTSKPKPSDLLLPDESVWISQTQEGIFARTYDDVVPKIVRKPAQLPQTLLQANTQDTLYLLTADGQAISLPAHQLPQSNEMSKGAHFSELGRLPKDQLISACLVLPRGMEGYLTLATVGGVVKRIDLDDLPGVTSDQFTVMGVAADDMLGWAAFTTGDNDIILTSAFGNAIRFKESEIRPMGLQAAGVMGMKLRSDEDGLIAMVLARPRAHLWTITDTGFAKYTPLNEYPVQGRYGQGVRAMSLPSSARALAGCAVGTANDKVTVLTTKGITKTVRLQIAPKTARSRSGSRVIALSGKDKVAGVVMAQSRLEKNTD